ncbi:unnamed protein product, partial [Owenia fusiformis]
LKYKKHRPNPEVLFTGVTPYLMASGGVERMDDIIREYLLFRGLGGTLKTYEYELKVDKDKGFRVDKITDLLNSYINNYDLSNLREYWSHLDQRVFSLLEYQTYSGTIRKLEVSLLKYYLINALQNNRADRVHDFFDKMTTELQSQAEWKDWFALPFLRNAEENVVFAKYFTKQWQDTLMVSLHNFLGVVFQNITQPALLQYDQDQITIKKLQDENELYRQQVTALLEKQQLEAALDCAPSRGSLGPVIGTQAPSTTNTSPVFNQSSLGSGQSFSTRLPSNMDVMDDFYNLINEDQEAGAPPKGKGLKSVIKNIAKPGSPLATKKMDYSVPKLADPGITSSQKKDVKQPSAIRKSSPGPIRDNKDTKQRITKSESIKIKSENVQTVPSNDDVTKPTSSIGGGSLDQVKQKQQEHEQQRRELLGLSSRDKVLSEKMSP